MHGFNNGLPMVKSLCNNHNIILLQEHWLSDNDLNKLDNIDDDFCFVGVSSMTDKLSCGILSGRPFGGVAILWNKVITDTKIIKIDQSSGRYIALGINLNKDMLIIHCVYFPCKQIFNDYKLDMSILLSHIESVMTLYPTANHCIAGDFNFVTDCSNTGLNLFNHITVDYNLFCCDLLNKSSVNFTYYHESLNQTSWLDHCFISNRLRNCVTKFGIIDSGLNCSDHLPISITLLVEVQTKSQSSIQGNSPIHFQPSKCAKYTYRWDQADLISYYSHTSSLLQSIVVPSIALLCNVDCDCNSHCNLIDKYYSDITGALQQAGHLCVPRLPNNALKPYWNDQLNKFKAASIDMHNLWRQCGSPRNGIINSARLKAKLDYKAAIIRTATEFERANADDLTDYFNTKDNKNFWKCWNKSYNQKSVNSSVIGGQTDPLAIAETFRNYFSTIFIDSKTNIDAVNEFNSKLSNFEKLNRSMPEINVQVIERCIKELKMNKAAAADGLVSEHIIHSHPAIVIHLKILFSMMDE